MNVKLQNTLTITLPESISFEYDYASNDGSKPGILHLTGDLDALKILLREALEIIA